MAEWRARQLFFLLKSWDMRHRLWVGDRGFGQIERGENPLQQETG